MSGAARRAPAEFYLDVFSLTAPSGSNVSPKDVRAGNRKVEYYNMGTLFPNEPTQRVSNFIDFMHLADLGATLSANFMPSGSWPRVPLVLVSSMKRVRGFGGVRQLIVTPRKVDIVRQGCSGQKHPLPERT